MVRAEVFPVERDRWIAVIDDHDFSTEASSPLEVFAEVRSAVREVLGWEDVTIELHDDEGRPWRPSDAPAQESRLRVDQAAGDRAVRRADDEIVYDVVEWATARGAWAADGVHLSREHVLALAEEIRLEVMTMLEVAPRQDTRRMHAEGFFRQERDRLVLDNQLDPRRQRAWAVINDFVAAVGPRARLSRRMLGESTSELARVDPVTKGAAAVEVLISDDDVLIRIGAGGRYELELDDEDLAVLAALLEAVAAGRYAEDVRIGASRYVTTLADGRTMQGSDHDALWSLRWGRRHLTYRPY